MSDSEYGGLVPSPSSASPVSGGKGLLKRKLDKKRDSEKSSSSDGGSAASANTEGSLHSGGTVRKTGNYRLRKGERVLTKTQFKRMRKSRRK